MPYKKNLSTVLEEENEEKSDLSFDNESDDIINNEESEELNNSKKINNKNTCNTNLENEYKHLNCSNENYYSNECNKFLLKKELLEGECLDENNNHLYPNLNDKEFNIKIAEKKEFNDTKYDGTIHKDIEKYANELINADFELQPHQAFVKNFMSFQTPYNSLLLYHGLGSGKTCSAIGVCEEMRDYMRQMGINKRIMIIASENVQDNFKLQLFDERKLKLIDGLWNIQSCTGNKLLKEINPTNMKGMPKEKIISQIKTIINTNYIFLGYGQFANYIIKTMNYNLEESDKLKKQDNKESKKIEKNDNKTDAKLDKKIIKRLQKEFNDRLIVIDEIHNIRKSDDNENKKVAINLEFLVKSAKNMRFLLLSATPMYNNYKEIIWLLNLMNMNDRRAKIDVKDVFDKYGNFKKNGQELLIRKATGYISFVRGENPYTFPYRVYPNEFAKQNTFPAIKYPSYQMNLKKIKDNDKNRILSLYLNTIGNCDHCGECQYCAYKYIIQTLRNKKNTITTKKGQVRIMPSFENMESFGYTMLQVPIESLIVSYPFEGLKNVLENIPREKYLEDYSPSFSEVEDIEENKPKEQSINTNEETIPNKNIGEDNNNENEKETEELIGGVKETKLIDPNELTGKKGLERMMTFIDSKSPPEKGNFEYKSTTINKYGKIFSQKIIGKYSAKIKNILEQIYNEETGIVSEGVILIYSQYIDSGLIPMALALEEMGFTRFGDKVKPFFKNKPTELVDVRTMKEPTDKKDFYPARYSIITGDPRISPNNDYEVKGLTNENNVDGHKVKVVLISKAGSEGIDFKFIRQVHIIDPWYNMNRIEQIIGRGVRNFSHKDLPFEKRNVQVYMYGTILGDENLEEAADLYVYRVAEYKAIQIGKVSRLLKETAVDCIINHGQTNFTQEKLSSMLDSNIVQELSNGLKISDFKIGDAPFSASCDYMDTCNYVCKPNKDIKESDLNEDTYNENFIIMNSEKILQRIRMLMKESYFYKKDVLISAIQTPKKYPYIQIYSALTQLIEDDNEFITDRYGRNGRLVNIGEYYLFQPIELTDKNVSIFDRMVPIDYKHDSVVFKINKDAINRQVIDKRNIEEVQENKRMKDDKKIEKESNEKEPNEKESNEKEPNEKEENEKELQKIKEGKLIFDEILVNFNLVRSFSKEKKVPRGDDNWYKHCGIVMKKFKKDFPEVTEQQLLEYLASHMIELLLYEEKYNLLVYLYSLDRIDKNSFEWFLKKYFENNIIVTRNLTAIILYNLNERVILLLNKDNMWVESQHEDQVELANSKEAKQFLENMDKNKYNKIIGFIGYEKKNKYLVFKTKNMESSRDTGARCDEAGKSKTLDILNQIVGDKKYTNETTKQLKDKDGNVIQEAASHVELCVFQEFLLRYFNDIKKDNKKWFLTPELALYYKIYKIII